MSNIDSYIVASDKIIISDLLYYVANKLHNTPFKTVVTACHNFYTDDDYVYNEKKKLCDATDEPCKDRRTDKKRLNNIEDICNMFLRRDSQNLFVPKFASLNLSNVPMNDDGNPSLGQVMAAIADMKRNMVTTDMLATSLQNFKPLSSSSSSSSAASTTPSSFVSSFTPTNMSFPPPLSPSAPSAGESIASATAPVSTVGNSQIVQAHSNLSFNKVISASTSSVSGRGGKGGVGGGERGARGGGA